LAKASFDIFGLFSKLIFLYTTLLNILGKSNNSTVIGMNSSSVNSSFIKILLIIFSSKSFISGLTNPPGK